MAVANWALNELLLVDGERYVVDSRTAGKEVNLRHQLDNRIVTMSDAYLMQKWTEGNLVRVPEAHRHAQEVPTRPLPRPPLSRKQRQEAERRFPYLKAYADRKFRRSNSRFLGPLITQVACAQNDNNPPAVPLVRNWIRKWEAEGCPDLVDAWRIAPNFNRRGKKKTEFDPEVEQLLNATIKRMWLVPTKASAKDILFAAIDRIERLDPEGREQRYLDETGQLKRPSLATVYRRMQQFAVDKVVSGQRGSEEAERMCTPVVRGPQASYPLEVVEIDHTALDVIVLDSTRNVPLGRPTITAAIDRYSRMILGFHIGFAPPSAHTVMLCLKNAIMPKHYLADAFPKTEMNWPCWGVPKAIVVDNGPEFHGNSFREASLALGFDIIYCPAGKPWFKGRIERWFGRLGKQVLHRIPGTTFSNPTERGRYKAEKKAVMTLNDLHATITKWVVKDYSVDIHSELYCSPLEQWERGVHSNPVMVPPSIEDLNVLLGRVEYRSLSRHGIHFQGLLYSSKSKVFRRLINRPDKPERVKVRIDDEDLSRVYVEDWISGELLSVPSTEPEYTTGLSLAAHKIFVGMAKKELRHRERVSIAGLVRVRAEADKYIHLLKKKKMLSEKTLVNALDKERVSDDAHEEPQERDDHLNLSASRSSSQYLQKSDMSSENEAQKTEEDEALYRSYLAEGAYLSVSGN